jgi:hypothetical protein
MGISFDPNWPRIGRWALLGTIVMVLWLLAPTVKCSWSAFRDEPLSEAMPQSDGSERSEEPGFFTRWGTAIKGCYKQTPLLGQEAWKQNVMFGCAGLTALAYLLASWEKRRKQGYDRS